MKIIAHSYPRGSYPTSEPTAGVPWFVQLADGQMCRLITGATGAINNLRLNYGCPNGDDLWGTPDRATPLWTIFDRHRGSGSLVKVGIATAWF